MPDINALRSRISTSLTDGRINATEAKGLIDAANQGGLTPEAKALLQSTVSRYQSRFDPDAATLMKNFLSTPAPAPGPVSVTRRDLADPTVLKEHANVAKYVWNDAGQLYVDGITSDDVIQGQIANCYMVSSF